MARKIVEGKIVGNERGYAFLIVEGSIVGDYFISHSDLRGALHGDSVLCETTDGVGERTTARVLKILERGYDRITGTYFSKRNGGYVVPDESKFSTDVSVPFGKGLRAKSGEKVVVKILSYPHKRNPEGMIIKVFGKQFEKSAELASILYSYKLPEKFPKSVLYEAESLPKEISKEDLAYRKDLRGLLTFTIDGDDSRDFDDAVSLEVVDGKYVLGVHIADVTHYVKEGSALNEEAFKRATSVYFPEKVIPMLPERLSNDLCSLVEGKDRLTLSCIMTFMSDGTLIDKQITPSIIRSSRRTTYSEVEKLLSGEKNEKLKEIESTLFLMDEFSDMLNKRRSEKGCIDLDVKESKITVDKKGVIEVTASGSDRAHKIIEEFMIAANKAVAEYFFFLDCPFIYRVHGEPTEERLENFYAFLSGIGINPKRRKDKVFSKDFQLILKNAEETPAFTVINRVMLRAMQKAKYSPEETGHFGLGEKYYSHFTSPIRRYPDLAIHRIIKYVLKYGTDNVEKFNDFVISASTQSSDMERVALEAERAVDDYYKILYISGFEGEEFDGYISGVTAFGIFVELENGIEGLVKLQTLKGGKYVFDSKKYMLSNGKNTYRLGEKVRIKVLGVNVIDKKAEFGLV